MIYFFGSCGCRQKATTPPPIIDPGGISWTDPGGWGIDPDPIHGGGSESRPGKLEVIWNFPKYFGSVTDQPPNGWFAPLPKLVNAGLLFGTIFPNKVFGSDLDRTGGGCRGTIFPQSGHTKLVLATKRSDLSDLSRALALQIESASGGVSAGLLGPIDTSELTREFPLSPAQIEDFLRNGCSIAVSVYFGRIPGVDIMLGARAYFS